MTALIARLEAATEGSRELDEQIVKALCPDAMIVFYCKGDEEKIVFHAEPLVGWKATVPHYTTSIDAALPGEEIHRVERVQSPTVTWWKAYQGIHIGQGKTEALARRIAALKARSAP